MEFPPINSNKLSNTFCNFPTWNFRGDNNPKAVFIGIPWDREMADGRALAPKYIREYSKRYFFNKVAPFEANREIKIEDVFFVADYGNLKISKASTLKTFDKITFVIKEILHRGTLPISIGGDHSISYPILRSYDNYQNIIFINLDAHLDFKFGINGARSYGNENVIRRISELNNISRIINIGTRGIVYEKHFKEAKNDSKILIYKSDGLIIREIIKKIKSFKPQGIYISLDIDVLDPPYAPACSSLEAGGLNYRELKEIITALTSEFNVIGFDLVEINPLFDKSYITASFAVQLLLDFIFALSLKK